MAICFFCRSVLLLVLIGSFAQGLLLTPPGRVVATDLESWLDGQGVERWVRIQDDTQVGGGRGLVATQTLKPGEVAAWVPVSATIRLEAAGRYDDEDNWAGVMAAQLMHETEKG